MMGRAVGTMLHCTIVNVGMEAGEWKRAVTDDDVAARCE